MQQIGRRIVFDIQTGKIISDLGEMQGDVLPRDTINGLETLDLPYGQDSDKFSRVKSYHVDVASKTVVFDELYDPPQVDKDAEITALQQQLLQAQGVI